MKHSLARLSAGELELLEMLWRAGGVTILEAQQALGLSIGYTTVQTRLNRLMNKGVAAKSHERPARYSAAISPQQVSARELETLIERVSGGQVVPLVAQLINRQRLTRDEIEHLKQLVAGAEKQSRSASRPRGKE